MQGGIQSLKETAMIEIIYCDLTNVQISQVRSRWSPIPVTHRTAICVWHMITVSQVIGSNDLERQRGTSHGSSGSTPQKHGIKKKSCSPIYIWTSISAFNSNHPFDQEEGYRKYRHSRLPFSFTSGTTDRTWRRGVEVNGIHFICIGGLPIWKIHTQSG